MGIDRIKCEKCGCETRLLKVKGDLLRKTTDVTAKCICCDHVTKLVIERIY